MTKNRSEAKRCVLSLDLSQIQIITSSTPPTLETAGSIRVMSQLLKDLRGLPCNTNVSKGFLERKVHASLHALTKTVIPSWAIPSGTDERPSRM